VNPGLRLEREPFLRRFRRLAHLLDQLAILPAEILVLALPNVVCNAFVVRHALMLTPN
jgi:hypothetical protein